MKSEPKENNAKRASANLKGQLLSLNPSSNSNGTSPCSRNGCQVKKASESSSLVLGNSINPNTPASEGLRNALDQLPKVPETPDGKNTASLHEVYAFITKRAELGLETPVGSHSSLSAHQDKQEPAPKSHGKDSSAYSYNSFPDQPQSGAKTFKNF